MTENPFTEHTLESAPDAARRPLERIQRGFGYIPSAAARMAASPQLLEGFQRANALFEAGTLDPPAREVVVMTVATRNSCRLCVALHSARLAALDADPDLVADLRARRPLGDARLEAVRVFTTEVLDRSGDVAQEALDAFFARGFTPRQALEVVLGVGTYTLSTLANRLTRAPVDAQLAARPTGAQEVSGGPCRAGAAS
ncbi:carboxymuconolactone decarboxylase family protein [Streptomyces boncukensis]|uniref:carboxymuconolactone decarboxylase family protein n=1 Tax=Streptomyces boncukensis TaxID=2711219 RepID=UPI0030BA18B7